MIMKIMVVHVLFATIALAEEEQDTVELPKEGCYYLETDHKFGVGETYNPIGICNTYKCIKDQTIGVLTCPLFVPAKGCRIGDQDLTKPYPMCCGKHVCDHDDSKNTV